MHCTSDMLFFFVYHVTHLVCLLALEHGSEARCNDLAGCIESGAYECELLGVDRATERGENAWECHGVVQTG